MTLDTALARISAIETALLPAQPVAGGASAPPGSDFSQVLGQTALSGAAPLGAPGSAPGSPAVVEAARSQVGQAEMPPGSNDSPEIAEYRGAVDGAVVGPWCADFASWCARQAGAPLGENGEGFQSVEALYQWAERSGRAVPAEAGPPRPGDLIVWGDEHVGIVEAVDPDGAIHTIEGNSSDEVAQRTYGPGASGATGYVRLG
jgi:hypothetical protein